MIRRILLILFIFFTFVTRTLSAPGEHPVFSRLTLSDFFGGIALIFGFHMLLRGLSEINTFSKIYTASFFLLICLFVPILFSLNQQATLMECIILFYLMLISVLLFITFKDNPEDLLFPLIMYTALAGALVGVYDYMAGVVGLPKIFSGRASGEILSGFRNAGQAGAYYLVIIAILFPMRFSNMYKTLSMKRRNLLNVSLFASLIFLALTGKIAAYIGIFAGLLGYAITKRNTRTIVALVFLGGVVTILFLNLRSIAPRVYERIAYKYETRISENLRGDIGEGDFLVTNLGEAAQAFADRPLTGTGLGAFYGSYSTHEVHSTYFKILGETGLIGALGYAAFVIVLFSLIKQRVNFNNQYSDYLRSMLPFIIGCFISWAYTYHLRKREFWILIVVILIVVYRGYREHEIEGSTIEK